MYGFLLLSYIVTLSVRRTVIEIFWLENAVTLKAGLGAREGHYSIESLWHPVDVLDVL